MVIVHLLFPQLFCLQSLDDSFDVRGSHRRTHSKSSANKLEDLGENQGLVPTKNADASR